MMYDVYLEPKGPVFFCGVDLRFHGAIHSKSGSVRF